MVVVDADVVGDTDGATVGVAVGDADGNFVGVAVGAADTATSVAAAGHTVDRSL